MAITINGSANTVAGLAVGGLPDGTVDAGTLATSAVTYDKLASSTSGSATSGLLEGGMSGNIIQVVQDQNNDDVETTDATWVNAGATLTITPKALSSKILIIANNAIRSKQGAGGALRLLRNINSEGDTTIHNPGPANSDGQYELFSASDIWARQVISVIDMPTYTAGEAIVYRCQTRCYNPGGSKKVVINDSAATVDGKSYMIAMEIKG